MRYSLFDLVSIPEGGSVAGALDRAVELARHAEDWGFHRYWVAEHHNLPGVASAATAVLIGHLAAKTQQIRIGAGGIMLPNHSPLTVAEAFGTLATLYPDRIDLGLGRAPGGDMAVMRALRRGATDDFARDVVELLGYLGEPEADALVHAIPGQGTHVPVWMLGSSLYGAGLAAHLGLPYVFASHFAPQAMAAALQLYRDQFKPSAYLSSPYVMIAINVFAADRREDAVRLRSSIEQAFANLRINRPTRLPKPVDDIAATIGRDMLAGVNQSLAITAMGTRGEIAEQLDTLIATYRPDEVLLTGAIHDTRASLRSFELAAAAMNDLNLKAA